MGHVTLDRPIKAQPAAGGIAQGIQDRDLMSAGWTDERHTLYISSMESSFIDQLKRGRNADHKDSSGNGFKVGDHESGIQTIRGRTPLSHERDLEACKGENLFDENTEASDQNFADDEAEVDAESSKACKKRRLSSTSAYCARMIK